MEQAMVDLDEELQNVNTLKQKKSAITSHFAAFPK